MCGIAGIMTCDGSLPLPSALQAMGQALAHRGPDGQGHYQSHNVALIQTRLAIIDLVNGNQPIFETGGAALMANGEIYNYVELRDELPGVVFSTNSDCELPLQLYRRYGLEYTEHLRGMYAIAIHDPKTGRLSVSRDPFGIKPLYYAETAKSFAFASEPEALIEAGIVAAELEPQTRNELVQLQYTTGRQTIYSAIKRVLPGETLVIEGGRIVERRRQKALPARAPLHCSLTEAVRQFDQVFADSVLIHQRSDVPYGMFLSGGIDSSAVLAMMARLNDRPVKAFTVGFPGTSAHDERHVARKVAKALGAEHIEVEFSADDFWQLLPEVARVVDDPTADYALLPSYKLAATAHAAGLKVILSGEGGDELFGGYGRYRSAIRPWWLNRKQMRRHGAFQGLDIFRIDFTGWRAGYTHSENENNHPNLTRLQKAQATDCADWLPNDLLTKLDRCLMAHGVEGRTPFLDTSLAAFAYCLPDKLKINRGLGKWMLRNWLAQYVPSAEPFSRKRGFTVPVGEWIAKRGKELGPLVAAQAGVKEICIPGAVESLFRELKTDYRFAAWTLLFYALWHQQHIVRNRVQGDVFAALTY